MKNCCGAWQINTLNLCTSRLLFGRICQNEYASLHDPYVHLEIDGKGKLLTKLQDKRDDFAHGSYVMPELAVTTQTFCFVSSQTSYNKASGTELCCSKIEVINTEVLCSSS